MRRPGDFLASCLVWTVGLALATTASGQAGEAGALPPQAELMFEDDFEEPELNPAWRVKVGQWKVADGSLRAKGPDAFLLLNKDAGTSMRLEYTAWSDDPCDLSACLNLDASASRPSGVFFQFGGMHNKMTAVAYGNARLWEGAEPLIRGGVEHRVICERWGVFARFFVDGKLLFHGVIPEVEKNGNAFVGFFIYKSGRIDDVKLYRFQGEPAGEILQAEPDLRLGAWLGFEDAGDEAPSKLPTGWSVDKGGYCPRGPDAGLHQLRSVPALGRRPLPGVGLAGAWRGARIGRFF